MDNAVGSAVVMELARMFSEMDYGPRRSVIFAFFTGEEKGLLGSSFYIDHPVLPLFRTIAMVNVDGLSAIGEFRSIIPVGGNYSSLGNTIDEIAAEYNLKTEQMPSNMIAEESFNRSDQISFARNGIPSILILEGFDYKNLTRQQAMQKNRYWFENIYHTPVDDLNQPIDYTAIQRYTQFVFAYCNRLLNMNETPQWNAGAPFRYKRLQHEAEER
jgi:Zn-dependent M28 family amino/carboxypeptidase